MSENFDFVLMHSFTVVKVVAWEVVVGSDSCEVKVVAIRMCQKLLSGFESIIEIFEFGGLLAFDCWGRHRINIFLFQVREPFVASFNLY